MLIPLIPQLARVCGPRDLRTLRTCHDLALWLARDGSPGPPSRCCASWRRHWPRSRRPGPTWRATSTAGSASATAAAPAPRARWPWTGSSTVARSTPDARR
ncbi:hypothetical protein ACFQ0M_30320 [Kitasatospora aburaviensis]